MGLLPLGREQSIWEVAKLHIHTHSLKAVTFDLGLLFDTTIRFPCPWNLTVRGSSLQAGSLGGLSLYQPGLLLCRMVPPSTPAEGISGMLSVLYLMIDQSPKTLQIWKSERHIHGILQKLDKLQFTCTDCQKVPTWPCFPVLVLG